jgi:ABC-type antimicrobial peptide transport system ATPase subunit
MPRLSTIANADRILVFNQGRLVEMGSHNELLTLGGIYKSLYEIYYAHQGIQEIPADVLENPTLYSVSE